MIEDLDSLILMTGGIPELGLDGGDGIGGPGGGSGFTQPVMASLGAAYGEEDETTNTAPKLPPNPTPAQVLEFTGNLTGIIVPAVVQGIVANSINSQGGVDIQALMAGLGQQQQQAETTGSSTSGMTAAELMMIMQMLQPSLPPPEPAMHPAVMASIGIGAVSVIMLVVALLMGRSGGRNVSRRAALKGLRLRIGSR